MVIITHQKTSILKRSYTKERILMGVFVAIFKQQLFSGCIVRKRNYNTLLSSQYCVLVMAVKITKIRIFLHPTNTNQLELNAYFHSLNYYAILTR